MEPEKIKTEEYKCSGGKSSLKLEEKAGETVKSRNIKTSHVDNFQWIDKTQPGTLARVFLRIEMGLWSLGITGKEMKKLNRCF